MRARLSAGRQAFRSTVGRWSLNIPAIKGIGGSLIYLVDRYGPGGSIYDIDFRRCPASTSSPGRRLAPIDHLTHNVHRGRMAEWSRFYEQHLQFREVRYFDIEGKLTGLRSKAMTSPCGKIRIPINESSDAKSQIEDSSTPTTARHSAHRARGQTTSMRPSLHSRAARSSSSTRRTLTTSCSPSAYPGTARTVAKLRKNRILLDGARIQKKGRKTAAAAADLHRDRDRAHLLRDHPAQGRRGLGEGNFKALFESMELDQIRRGVLRA